ncbi:MAG: hypothetical protein QM658_08235 [Gordonia sp. (in: high G+C Gram-positive bacteria)]
MKRRLASTGGIAVTTTLFVLLVAAFRFLPQAISDACHSGFGDQTARIDALSRGLTEFWRSGGPGFPPELANLVDYWRVWHATKIVICVFMVVVLIALAWGLWIRYVAATSRAPVWATAAGFVTVLVFAAAFVLAVNVQATAGPSIALLPMLSERPADPALVGTLREMKTGLTDGGSTAAASPALQTLIDDAARYHWTLAVASLVLGVVAAGAAVVAWRRRSGAEHASRNRTAATVLGVVTTVGAVLLLGLAAAGTVSALDPEASLVAVLGIG